MYLSIITTISAPFGAYLVQRVDATYVWYVYLFAVIFLAYKLFSKTEKIMDYENFKLVCLLAVPISVLSGFLGVGPGFLLMPTMIILGFEVKKAAGITAVAVTLPSFSALVPHLTSAKFDLNTMLGLIIVGAMGSFLGARLSSIYLPSQRIKQIFAVLIVIMTAYKIAMVL